jgi:O-antigen/teichoic acid export membrane protein
VVLCVVLCAAGFTLNWLMRAIALYLPIFAMMALMKNIMQAVNSNQSNHFRLNQARLATAEN